MNPEDFHVTEAKVTYTTKELLIRIDQRFDRLESLVTNAPSRSELQILDGRVSQLETDAVSIKAVAVALQGNKESRFNKQDKLVLGMFGFITTVLNVLAVTNHLP